MSTATPPPAAHGASGRPRLPVLLASFVASSFAMGLAVHVAVVGASVLLGGSAGLAAPSPAALALVATLVGVFWASVGIGALLAWLDVRAGGVIMARRLGAVRAFDRSGHVGEARLLRTVAELSIAAGVPRPETFVLHAEEAINALVLGDDGRWALVVTGGALEALDDDELRGVIAHELVDVRSRDRAADTGLVVALGGVLALDGAGAALIERAEGAPLHPAALVGRLLRGIGTLGAPPAMLLRAMMARRRCDLAADAGAVRLTRAPRALGSALGKVRAAGYPAALRLACVERLRHLCFTDGVPSRRGRRPAFRATIDARIEAIERHAATRSPASKAAEVESGPAPAPAVGRSDALVSDRIVLLLPDERSCLAALFALFVPGGVDDASDTATHRAFADRVTADFDRAFADIVMGIPSLLVGELESDRLGVVTHAAARLRGAVHARTRRRLLLKLERAACTAGRGDLESLATLALIRRHLDVEFPTLDRLATPDGARSRADGRAAPGADDMSGPFALLLSFAAREPYEQREPESRAALEEAFQALLMQPVALRRAFVERCTEVCRAGTGRIGWMTVFAAALDCEGPAPSGRTVAPSGRTVASA